MSDFESIKSIAFKNITNVINRLEAWAEYHEARCKVMSDSECASDRNSAKNYRDQIAELYVVLDILKGAKS